MYSNNQQEVFRTDPTLIQLSQNQPVRFTGCLHGKDSERRNNFIQSMNDKRLSVAFAVNGVNIDLVLSSVKVENDTYVIESNLVFNGCSVRFKGRMSRQSLTGTGLFEFDPERAKKDAKISADAIRPFQQRIENLQNIILR